MFISDEVDAIPYTAKHNYHTVFTLYLRYTRSKPYENTFTLIKPFCKKEVSHSTAQTPLPKKNGTCVTTERWRWGTCSDGVVCLFQLLLLCLDPGMLQDVASR